MHMSAEVYYVCMSMCADINLNIMRKFERNSDPLHVLWRTRPAPNPSMVASWKKEVSSLEASASAWSDQCARARARARGKADRTGWDGIQDRSIEVPGRRSTVSDKHSRELRC